MAGKEWEWLRTLGAKWGGMKGVGAMLLVLAVVGFWMSGQGAWQSWYPVAYQDAPIQVPTAKAKAADANPAAANQTGTAQAVVVNAVTEKASVTMAMVPCPADANLNCYVVPSGLSGKVDLMAGATLLTTIFVVPLWQLLLAGGSILCLLVGIPWAIFPKYGQPWGRLLSEPGGGLSLSRTQMALWAGAAAVAYFGLAISRGGFVTAPDEIWKLLLMAGATTAVSAVATPTQGDNSLERLRSNAKEVLLQLRSLGSQASLPKNLQAEIDSVSAALAQAQPGTWDPVRDLLETALMDTVTALKNQVSLPQDLLFKLTQTLYSDPTPQALTDTQAMWKQISSEVTAAPVFAAETESAFAALGTYWVEPLEEKDMPGFVANVSKALKLTLRDLAARKITVSDKLSRAVKRLNTDLILVDPSVPKLTDLVENWQGEGDFSRLQYLVLTIGAVAIFLVQFFRQGSFPTIPDEFLWMVGASQATYVGVKWGQKLTQPPAE